MMHPFRLLMKELHYLKPPDCIYYKASAYLRLLLI